MDTITIIMPCYNKERYIAQALDSVFAQKVDFPCHVIIADDCSTDRTLAIVGEYVARYPGIFEILKAEKNLGLFANVRRAYAICKTPYFCVLDPDDYWTDERHLQKAVDFLSRHRGFTIYCAGIEMLYRDGRRENCDFPSCEVDSDYRDFLCQNAVIAYTQTCVYRNVVFANGLPEKVKNPPCPSMFKSFRGDSFRNFIHIQRGKAHFSPGVEACYRQTEEGVFQGLGDAARLLLNAQFLADCWRYDDGAYPQLLAQSKRTFDRALPVLLSGLGGSRPEDEKSGTQARELSELYGQNRWVAERGLVEMFLGRGYLWQRFKDKLRRRLK